MSDCIDHGQLGNKDGYGKTTRKGRTVLLHRLALADRLQISVFSMGLQANHTCNNPRCVNPDHLYLGSQLENMRDKLAAGTTNKGERNGNHKISDEDAQFIRETYVRGHRFRKGNSAELAERFAIDTSQVLNIARGTQRD